ncbi:TPA: hypothetical protein QCI71_001613 [Enterobacter chuandaensis]|nr:hypothetical protein [Enterobacter chuandaensis]
MDLILSVRQPTREELNAIHAELMIEYADRPLTSELKQEIAEAARQRICQIISVVVLPKLG